MKKRATATPKRREAPTASGKKTRAGTGAHGARGTPAGRDRGPKWPGGGTKGENEQTAR